MESIPFGPTWNIINHPGLNCSRKIEPGPEWNIYGVERPIFGWWSIISGIISELYFHVLYAPCAMALREERHNSCYKIMLWITVNDMLTLVVSSILYGIGMINGDVFCSNPVFYFWLGAYGLGCYAASCVGCLLLVSNRLAELLNKGTLFEGHRTTLLLIIPVLYGLSFTFLTPPPMFNSKHQSYFFNPYIDEVPLYIYHNFAHAMNNIGVVLCTTLMYCALCTVLIRKTGAMSTDAGRKRFKANKGVFIQAAIMCGSNLFAAVMYVYMNFFYTPPLMIVLGHISWQVGLGSQPVLYLTVNQKIRRYVKGYIGLAPKYHRETSHRNISMSVPRKKSTKSSLNGRIEEVRKNTVAPDHINISTNV